MGRQIVENNVSVFSFQGLFSRITFREPVFIGGPGNTTGLSDKLPIEVGLKGCIRHIDINDHSYSFELSPDGDSVKGFDVGKCNFFNFLECTRSAVLDG